MPAQNDLWKYLASKHQRSDAETPSLDVNSSLCCRGTILKQPEVYLVKKPTLTVTRISSLNVWGFLLWATLRRETVPLAVQKFVNQHNVRTKKTAFALLTCVARYLMGKLTRFSWV